MILKRTWKINPNGLREYNVPGLLLVDTPGHEIFTNLRQKGIVLADIAIVIIDLVHGLEPQTIESIKMLTDTNTPFVFVLNKIDRLYGFDRFDNVDKFDNSDTVDKTDNSNILEIKTIKQILSKQNPNIKCLKEFGNLSTN